MSEQKLETEEAKKYRYKAGAFLLGIAGLDRERFVVSHY